MSVFPLVLAIIAGALGIAMSRFATPTNVVAPIIGWALCAVGDVLAVAAFQMKELNAASASMNYRSAPTSGFLRFSALAFAAIGILLNSLAIAQWVATR